MTVAVRELHTAQEVFANRARVKNYFSSLKPADSEKVRALTAELETIKSERDAYRARCGELLERLKSYEVPAANKVTMERVAHIVGEHYGIDRQDLISRSRNAQIMEARQIAMHLCHHLTQASYFRIARFFKRAEHSTVYHASKDVKARIVAEPAYAEVVESLARQIQNPHMD